MPLDTPEGNGTGDTEDETGDTEEGEGGDTDEGARDDSEGGEDGDGGEGEIGLALDRTTEDGPMDDGLTREGLTGDGLGTPAEDGELAALGELTDERTLEGTRELLG